MPSSATPRDPVPEGLDSPEAAGVLAAGDEAPDELAPLEAPAPAATAAAAAAPVTSGPPAGLVQETADLNAIPQDPDALSRDGGASVALNGTSTWVFGDTLTRLNGADGNAFAANTGVTTTDLDAAGGISLVQPQGSEFRDSAGMPAEVIPLSPWESYYNYYNHPSRCDPAHVDCGRQYFHWPGAGVADPANNRSIFIFVIGIRGGTAPPEGITMGWSIAYRSSTGVWTRPEVAPPGEWDKWTMFKPTEGPYGDPVVYGSDVYSYRCVPLDFIERCSMAKVPLSQFADRSAWRYYIGNDTAGTPQWSTNVNDPAIVSVVDIGRFWSSAYYNTYLQKFVIVSGNGDGAHYNTSPTPWGPWSDSGLLFDGVNPQPHPQAGCPATPNYAIQAHPEYGSGQTLYVTYSRVWDWRFGHAAPECKDTGYWGFQELRLQRVTFAPPGHYRNPGVEDGASPSPFVIKSAGVGGEPAGRYYAYASGFSFWGVNFAVPTLWSPDLVRWTAAPNSLPVLPAWAVADGSKFSAPSVLYIPSNPDPSKYVMYFTAVNASTGEKCIGAATAAVAAGPFTPQPTPLICAAGGVRDPSLAPFIPGVYQQLVYRKDGSDPGIYRQFLELDGMSLHSGGPKRIYVAQAGGWQQGIVERPAIAFHGGNAYLFFSAGTADSTSRAIGWSTCSLGFGVLVNDCLNPPPTAQAPLVTGGSVVNAPSSAQVFSDGTYQWFAYTARPPGTCTGSGCSAVPNLSIDKLCFSAGAPRTNAPTRTIQPLARNATCTVDVP